MGSAGSDGPTVAFRVVLEHHGDRAPSVDEVVEALQACAKTYYVEVHRAGDPCAEVGHLQGDQCRRCTFNKQAGRGY